MTAIYPIRSVWDGLEIGTCGTVSRIANNSVIVWVIASFVTSSFTPRYASHASTPHTCRCRLFTRYLLVPSTDFSSSPRSSYS